MQNIRLATDPSPKLNARIDESVVDKVHPQQESREFKRCTIQSKFLRNSIVGFSDGLTVPFALTAGLSSLGDTAIVITGGLAELIAGSISMGLGAYLAAVTERKQYAVEHARQLKRIRDTPAAEEEALYHIFENYGIRHRNCEGIIDELKNDQNQWLEFIMAFKIRMDKPDRRGAFLEGLVMGLSYFIGGILPMIPYFGTSNLQDALYWSILIGVFILLGFGYLKSFLTGDSHRMSIWSAVQTLLNGAAAAGLSFGVVKSVNAIHDNGNY